MRRHRWRHLGASSRADDGFTARSLSTRPDARGDHRRRSVSIRRGVCQDLTHIFVAAARVLGIPGRYIGGHFHRADGVTSQEAGHAWAEAYIENLGWVGFDPTNGICTTEAHVRVAAGLDYLGAAPVRGTRVGGAGESLKAAAASIRRAAKRSQCIAKGLRGRYKPAVWQIRNQIPMTYCCSSCACRLVMIADTRTNAGSTTFPHSASCTYTDPASDRRLPHPAICR